MMEIITVWMANNAILAMFFTFLLLCGVGNGISKVFQLYLNHRLEMKRLEVKRQKLIVLESAGKRKQLSENTKPTETDNMEGLSKEDKELIKWDIIIKKLDNV